MHFINSQERRKKKQEQKGKLRKKSKLIDLDSNIPVITLRDEDFQSG